VIENGAVRQQNVTLGMQEGNLWEIMEGLKGTEILAASNLNEITTGMKVTLGEAVKTPARSEQASDGAAAPPPTGQDGQRRSSGGARRGFGGN